MNGGVWMSDKQNVEEDTRQWFLRINGETVFGPVSTEGLIVWAEQGRILPGHEISVDRKHWKQAVTEPLLDMRWFVDDGESDLRGPLNRQAAEALLKSGKVAKGAQLVSADDVEDETSEHVQTPRSRSSRSKISEEDLRTRIHELESLVETFRAAQSQETGDDELIQLRQSHAELNEQFQASEAERGTLVLTATKDTRANERKLEGLRQQIKKLEQRIEEADGRVLLADVSESQMQELKKTQITLSEKLAASEATLAQKILELEQMHATWVATQQALSEKELQVMAYADQTSDLNKQIIEQENLRQAAEDRVQVVACESTRLKSQITKLQTEMQQNELALAELLVDANARDADYQEQIAALTQLSAFSPSEMMRLRDDQAALYDLMKAETDELDQVIAREREQVEHLKELSGQRQQKLIERRQELLKRLGKAPSDMTRRAVLGQPPDSGSMRLRTEFDNLRITHEREVRRAEERERDLQQKIRVLETECSKLCAKAAEGDTSNRRLEEIKELLAKREQELSDERRGREAEREQYHGSQQALLMRIDTLEKASKPATPNEIQSAEARSVKLATWMRLKH